MATYLQGITDYIPQLQPFQPDFNFLGNVLQTKQTRYDAAHKQLSSLYGTMLNSPMLRDENLEKRSEFFRSIDENVKRLSGVDLSLQQNVDQASELFKGLYEDKDIVKDMTWTKNWMNKRDKGDFLKTCADPEKCGGQWWEGGDKYLDYKAQEFKTASKEEALSFQDVDYIPAQNFTDKAFKAAADAKLSVKWDEVKGDWIVHHKNGKQLVPTLTEFYISKFGNDASMMSFMKAQSYIKRKDWVAQNVSNYNNNEAEANIGYLNAVFTKGMTDLTNSKKEADEKDEISQNQSRQVDEYIEKNGYTESQGWVTDWTAIKDQTAITQQVKETYTKAVDNANLTKYNKDNIKLYLDQIDNIMGMSMLKSYSKNAAEEYAYGTEEQTRDVNPLAVQARSQAFQAQQAREKQGYLYTDPQTGETKYQPGVDFYEKKAIKELEWQHLDEATKAAVEKIVPDGGKETADVNQSKDSATPPFDPNLSSQENIKQATTTLTDNITSKKNLVTNLLDAAINANRKEQMAAGSGTKLLDLKPFLNDIGLSGPIGNKYKIDYIKVLKGDKTEYDKYVSLLTSNTDILDKAYNSSSKWGDPSDSLGALAYSNGWTTDKGLQDKLTAYKDESNKSGEEHNWMLDFNKNQTDKAKKEFNSEMAIKNNAGLQPFNAMFEKTIDPTTNMVVNLPAKAIKDNLINPSLNRSATNPQSPISSRNDFKTTPKDYRLKMVHEAALDWADKNKAKFKEEIIYKYDISRAKEVLPQKTNEVEGIASAYYKAYQFAVDSYTNLKPEYEKTKPESWNGEANQRGNARFSVASRGYVDAVGGKKIETNKTLFELYDNYSSLKASGDAIVGTGNSFSKEELDKGDKKWAAQILEGYMTDMQEGAELDKNGRPKDDARARADFGWTRVAAASNDWIGFKLDFSPQWIEKNTSTKTKTKLIPNDSEKIEKLQDGIVVFLKKSKVKGDFMTKSEYTVDDARMDKDGYMTLENKAGSATLRRNPAGFYEVTTFLNVVNSEGKIEAQGGIPEAVDQSFSPSLFREIYTKNLNALQYINQHALGDYAAKNGNKNPQEVVGK